MNAKCVRFVYFAVTFRADRGVRDATTGDMSGLFAGITCESSKDFNERNLRFRPEWGNHKSA